MLSLGGAVTLMRPNIEVVFGDIDKTYIAKPRQVFYPETIEFLNALSRRILQSEEIRKYKDLSAIAFFLRKSYMNSIRKEYDIVRRVGLGLAFHITPSNIPVQFFYSLAVSLLAGNTNIIRLSAKRSSQEKILIELMKKELANYPAISDYICLVRYGHEKVLTDEFSSKCDVRIIWGGDQSISSIRESPLPARAFDVTFADRFSLCLIKANAFLKADNNTKDELVSGFYYDTYFSDQNACSSPRMVIWLGDETLCKEAAKIFWKRVAQKVKENYEWNGIAAVEKLIKECDIAIETEAIFDYGCSDINYINVVTMNKLISDISRLKGNRGLFLQSYIGDIDELIPFIQKDWQTLVCFGDDLSDISNRLVYAGVKGIDRITSIGKSAVPSLRWDGIDFIERLSRSIDVFD